MAKYSMGSSVAESKQTSVPPSLTNWRRAPRESAPIEKGKTAPCNRSPANKTPKPTLSRSCPPKSVPRSEKDGHSSSSAFIALKCDCGGQQRVISFITEQKVIHKILAHLEKRKSDSHPPP